MRMVAIYTFQPAISNSGWLQRARPDSFFNSDEHRFKEQHPENLGSYFKGEAES
ncbi:MAG: hypothetical protein DF168_01095 [Candidatus Moanabacter tarae]|uniref:Uncharacterized protein n=1 Tax=Candidatus Moanibacter tarae TaxID=2200854 RepID=A0A2Z4AFW5_9BACT|nr:MAG: hypothetical protein DF168_01095 [Candidatus Moanabacter tarae]